MSDILKFKDFLLWLITPINANEQEAWDADKYCEIANKIDEYSKEELIELINVQLQEHELEVDEFSFADYIIGQALNKK